MQEFLGVVVNRSLKREDFIRQVHVVAERQVGSWRLMLVSIPEDALQARIESFQAQMQDGTWYAHFFRGDDLIVVYRDRVFWMTLNPETWTEAVQYGLDHGFPMEQLDFRPRTRTEAAADYGLTHV